MLVGNGTQGFEGPLDNPLGPDVFPWCRGVLGEHGQIFFLEVIKYGPGGFHDVGGGHDHARRKLVGFENGHRHARLHHQGFVVFQVF